MVIVYVVNVDWFFLSHRLPLAIAARNHGASVYIIAANTGHKDEIESYGFNFVDFPFTRKGTSFMTEIMELPRLYMLYRKIKPDLIHHVTIKPVIYGSLVARLLRRIKVVNAITGMGFVFSMDKKASALKNFVKRAYRIAFNNTNVRVIFQNEDDRNIFIDNKLVKNHQALLIRGSGVDSNVYRPSDVALNTNCEMVLLASRMIWDKGIKEFIEASEIVRRIRPNVRFVLAGKVDIGNPNVIPYETLDGWVRHNHIEWIGHITDMPTLLHDATIVTLPTYYPEGVPKILIEAALAGKSIITTNRPGCRDIVRDGENGILIPEKNSQALAEAIIYLLQNPKLRELYGVSGRKLAIEHFSEDKVVSETMNVYDDLLGKHWRSS